MLYEPPRSRRADYFRLFPGSDGSVSRYMRAASVALAVDVVVADVLAVAGALSP